MTIRYRLRGQTHTSKYDLGRETVASSVAWWIAEFTRGVQTDAIQVEDVEQALLEIANTEHAYASTYATFYGGEIEYKYKHAGLRRAMIYAIGDVFSHYYEVTGLVADQPLVDGLEEGLRKVEAQVLRDYVRYVCEVLNLRIPSTKNKAVLAYQDTLRARVKETVLGYKALFAQGIEEYKQACKERQKALWRDPSWARWESECFANEAAQQAEKARLAAEAAVRASAQGLRLETEAQADIAQKAAQAASEAAAQATEAAMICSEAKVPLYEKCRIRDKADAAVFAQTATLAAAQAAEYAQKAHLAAQNVALHDIPLADLNPCQLANSEYAAARGAMTLEQAIASLRTVFKPVNFDIAYAECPRAMDKVFALLDAEPAHPLEPCAFNTPHNNRFRCMFVTSFKAFVAARLKESQELFRTYLAQHGGDNARAFMAIYQETFADRISNIAAATRYLPSLDDYAHKVGTLVYDAHTVALEIAQNCLAARLKQNYIAARLKAQKTNSKKARARA